MQQSVPGRYAKITAIYLGAVGTGWVAAQLHLPLPWMIGALIFATGISLGGVQIKAPALTRPAGQIVVAGSVGLAFTPAALESLGAMFLPMVIAALLTIAAGFLVAWVLMRLSDVDAMTATLASVPMGPVESANLAQRYGVAPGPVVFAQTLRIMALVLLIPPAILLIDGSVDDPSATLRNIPWTPAGTVLLLTLAILGALLFKVLRISNPFFLGPLAASAAASAAGLPVTASPYVVLAGAQVLLGVWLGAVINRDLFRRAGRFVPAALLSTLLMILLCLVLALILAPITGTNWATMVLATAPGSVTEMALTAKVLQESVALVTAYHITRIFIIIPSAPLLTRITARLTHWTPPKRD
ncbi:AbrB family transcriptional regulator [Roseinatronobacter alkalisoli]|uniref:AbrB family transcriptional regulator n=1 Tax=Roseinatronobacter alkalisoli TaxID=3028235 RepID=A0ABT5TAT3_9RHOB|nr:AbrB family transcriptional regulator [Roseinatronobacter sp. HJB301]MDD7972239.1 AbrB family transcriptional regulator [Roseinatronobacter sp. HJB301]